MDVGSLLEYVGPLFEDDVSLFEDDVWFLDDVSFLEDDVSLLGDGKLTGVNSLRDLLRVSVTSLAWFTKLSVGLVGVWGVSTMEVSVVFGSDVILALLYELTISIFEAEPLTRPAGLILDGSILTLFFSGHIS